MRLCDTILILLVLLYGAMVLFLGIGNSETLRDGAIEGWFWGLSSFFGVVIAVAVFNKAHAYAVNKAFAKYPEEKNALLSSGQLIGAPALLSLIALCFVMVGGYAAVWFFGYERDSKAMANESFMYLGNPLRYLLMSVAAAIIANVISLWVLPLAERMLHKQGEVKP